MRRTAHAVLLVSTAMFLTGGVPADSRDDEHPQVTTSSQEFKESYERVMAELEKRGFGKELESFSLGSLSGSELESRLAAIRRATPIKEIAVGDSAATYDVILQPGHYGRTSGRTGTSGKHISEKDLVAYLVDEMAKNLRKRNLRVLVISADQYASPLRGRIFLAVHADGRPDPPCKKTGPSLAYETKTSPYAMHAIGWALSEAMGYRYEEFQKDNYTPNTAGYYMYRNVETTAMKGLLEVGELTCPKWEDRLIASSDIIAKNVAHALAFLTELNAASPR